MMDTSTQIGIAFELQFKCFAERRCAMLLRSHFKDAMMYDVRNAREQVSNLIVMAGAGDILEVGAGGSHLFIFRKADLVEETHPADWQSKYKTPRWAFIGEIETAKAWAVSAAKQFAEI